MQNDILTSLSRLSDAELVVRLKGLVARERETTARRFPVILDMLAEGSVNLTTVKLLASHLTPANHRDVLESARGKKKPEVEEIVARLSPRPDVPASIRRLPTPNPIPPASPAPTQMLTAPTVAASPLWVRPAAVEPLSPDRYKLQLTIAGDTLEKLRLAKDMLGHAIPSSDDAAILDRALTALLAELAKKKFADTRNPRPSRGTKAGARAPSAQVKRAVWLRVSGAAPSSAPAAIAAASVGSSNSTTSTRTPWEARQPSTRSSCGAVVTTITKGGCISATVDLHATVGSFERNRRRIDLTLRQPANLFWNKSSPRSGLSGALGTLKIRYP